MSLFSTNGNSYLGIDIGTSSIKLCELSAFNGRPKLLTYGFSERNVSLTGTSFLNNTDEAALAIKNICEKANVQTKKAITALPNFSVFSSILNLPSMTKKELASAITWEAKKNNSHPFG
jgi:Tfp pilus assembly PilM family ATPase